MMTLTAHPLFGLFISFAAYMLSMLFAKRVKHPLANPLLISTIIIIALLKWLNIPLENYMVGGSMINLMMLPAIAVLAVSIYRQAAVLKAYFWPLVIGCLVGSITSMTSVWLMCRTFQLDDSLTAALIPKSVTTAIAVEIARARGGIVAITIVAVLFSGFVGAIFAPTLIRIMKIKDPVIAGVAIGTSSHALGTSKAIEIGEVEGAMSSLSIGIAGLITALLTLLF
jgi:predicted murein hydrolase (TIGR00659 family)